jgi:peroxiredoxin
MTSDPRPARIPRAGDPAPNFQAYAVDGETVTLADHPKPVALVFLRHLA